MDVYQVHEDKQQNMQESRMENKQQKSRMESNQQKSRMENKQQKSRMESKQQKSRMENNQQILGKMENIVWKQFHSMYSCRCLPLKATM